MPRNEIGVTFAPTFENAERGRTSSASAAPQGAIKTLNFKLPSVTGAASSRALSPLVGDERRGSTFGGAVLQSVLRTVLGASQAATQIGAFDGGFGGGGDESAAMLQALAAGSSPSAMGTPAFGGGSGMTPAPTIHPGSDDPMAAPAVVGPHPGGGREDIGPVAPPTTMPTSPSAPTNPWDASGLRGRWDDIYAGSANSWMDYQQ